MHTLHDLNVAELLRNSEPLDEKLRNASMRGAVQREVPFFAFLRS